MKFPRRAAATTRALAIAAAIAGLASCQAAPRDASTAQDRGRVLSVLELPPPPGIGGEALVAFVRERGGEPRTLEEALAAIDASAIVPAATVGAAPADPPPIEAQRAFAAGRMALRSGARFEARRQLERALDAAPGDPAVLRSLGRLYAGTGNLDRAVRLLRSAIEASPDDTQSLYLLGQAASAENAHADAAAYFHAVIDRAGEDARGDAALPIVARFRLAAALQQLGYAGPAAEQLDAFLNTRHDLPYLSTATAELRSLDQTRDRHYQSLGDLYLLLDRPADALAAFETARELGRDDPAITARLVYGELLAGDPAEARALALSLFMDARTRTEAVALLSYLARHGEGDAPLVDAVTRAYETTGRDAATALALAELLDRDRASAFLAGHLGHSPDDVAVLLRLVRLELGDEPTPGSAARAVGAVRPLLERRPERSPRAVEAFFAVLDDPALLASTPPAEADASPGVRLLYGAALARVGRFDDAASSLGAALGAMPTLLAARVELAAVALALDDPARAESLVAPISASSGPRAVSVKVEVLRRLGRGDQALALLERSRAESSSADLALLQAELLAAADRPDDAERLLLDALTVDPGAEPIYAALFELYDSDNPPSDSVTQYQRLLRRVLRELPQSRIARYKLGELHVVGNRLAQAEKQLLPLVREDPTDTEAMTLLLQAYAKANRLDAAAARLDDALLAAPRHEPLLELALRFFPRAQKPERAVEVGRRLLELGPPAPERDLAIALLFIELDRLDDARPLVERLLDRHGDEPDHLRLGVRFYNAVEDVDGAARVYEKLLMQQPAGPQRDQSLAVFYLQRDRPAEAAPLLEALLAEDEVARGDVLTSLLWQAYAELDRPDDAFAAIDRGVERFPAAAAELRYQASILHNRLNDPDAAEAALRAALALDAEHPAANNGLAYHLSLQNRELDAALEMARRAVRQRPDSAAFLDTLGWVLYKRGDFDAAVGWLERSRRAEGGEYPLILDHLGDALYRAGKPADAAQAWREALGLMTGREWPDTDPELEGLDARLEAKLEALEAGRKPATAIVPANEAA